MNVTWIKMLCVVSLAMMLAAAPSSACAQDAAVADAVAITPDEAASHAGKECVVAMRVNSSRHMADAGRCYLNSQKDFREENNLTVVIFKRGLESFAVEKIEDPAEHFRGKTIRVTGTVEMYKDKPQIKVDRADQIEIVPEADAAEGGAGRAGQE
jgi:DNA/RNA endonuclease YhcR with UshA esterase domain